MSGDLAVVVPAHPMAQIGLVPSMVAEYVQRLDGRGGVASRVSPAEATLWLRPTRQPEDAIAWYLGAWHSRRVQDAMRRHQPALLSVIRATPNRHAGKRASIAQRLQYLHEDIVACSGSAPAATPRRRYGGTLGGQPERINNCLVPRRTWHNRRIQHDGVGTSLSYGHPDPHAFGKRASAHGQAAHEDMVAKMPVVQLPMDDVGMPRKTPQQP